MPTTTHNGSRVAYSRLFLRPSRHGGGYDVMGDYTAPASSVLAGQVVSQFLAWFPTEEEARANYPDADAGYSQAARPSVAHLPDGPDGAQEGQEWDSWADVGDDALPDGVAPTARPDVPRYVFQRDRLPHASVQVQSHRPYMYRVDDAHADTRYYAATWHGVLLTIMTDCPRWTRIGVYVLDGERVALGAEVIPDDVR